MIIKRLIWVRAGNRGNLGNILKVFCILNAKKTEDFSIVRWVGKYLKI